MVPAVRSAKGMTSFGQRNHRRISFRSREGTKARPMVGYGNVTLLGLLLVTAGCAAPLCLPSWPASGDRQSAHAITQISMIWSDAALYVNGTAVAEGLAGRIYLFGADRVRPVFATGKLSVYVYDESPPFGRRVKPEFQWEFTAEELAQHETRDIIGPSYLVWVPVTDKPLAGRKLSMLVRLTEPSGRETLSGMASVEVPPPRDAVLAAAF